MKKTSPAAKHPKSGQSVDQKTARSVVTRLRARSDKSQDSTESEIDLKALLAELDELPNIDATKLVSLNRRIVNGDYKIDSERLAEKLIKLESSLDD